MNYYTKKLYILPLLGFFAAGCSTSSNLQTSETDDVYFSSSDKVAYVEPVYDTNAQEATAYEGEYSEDIEGRVSDPETYAENGRRSNNPYQYSYYDAPFGNPFYAYHDPFYYPGRYYSRAVLVDPWMDPWYDPFYGPSMAMYDPFWPRYGSGISISVGMGWGRAYNPWGYGRYGYGYNPYGYGFGNRYYGGGYYDGYRGGIIASNRIQYAPRGDRSSNTGHNPNISRDGRNSSVIAPERERTSRSGRTQSGEISRPRSSQGQAYPGSTTQPARTRSSSSTPATNQERTSPAPTRTRTREIRTSSPNRSSEGTYSPPTRRQRNDSPAPSVRRESAPTRSYEPPVRSSYEPSRSSSSSSGSSSGSSGSSSGSGRRGRN